MTALGLCTRDPGHGEASVPWSGERLCWDCADTALDLLAKACETELPVTIGKGVTTPGFAYEWKYPESRTDSNGHATPTAIFAKRDRDQAAEQCLVEDVVAAVMAAAGGDPALAEELIRDMKYLKQANCC